jgi:hypothetical protein
LRRLRGDHKTQSAFASGVPRFNSEFPRHCRRQLAIHDWNTPDRVTVNDNYKLRWNSMPGLGNIYERDQCRELIMMRLAFAIGLLALGFTAITPARADFAIVEFSSGYCRVWTDTISGPQDGRYLHFPYPWSWHWRFHTFEGANMAMYWAVAHHRCHHWQP